VRAPLPEPLVFSQMQRERLDVVLAVRLERECGIPLRVSILLNAFHLVASGKPLDVEIRYASLIDWPTQVEWRDGR
jgi:hypothetical protein